MALALRTLLILVFLSACSTSTTSSPPSTTAGGTGNDGGGDGIDGASGTTGASQNVICDEPKASADTGKGTKFAGFTYKVRPVAGCGGNTETQCPATSNVGKTYNFTCTMCPGGLSNVQGKFKQYEEEGGPASPDPNVWRETIEFDGNTFLNVIEGEDCGDNTRKKVTAKGYYFCAKPGEVDGMKYEDWWSTVFVYTEVEPAGAFGIEPGDSDLVFFGFANGGLGGPSNDILLQLNSCWDAKGSKQNEYQYCKVGDTVNGTECPDPFAAQ